jgi:ankyrin repeat protein
MDAFRARYRPDIPTTQILHDACGENEISCVREILEEITNPARDILDRCLYGTARQGHDQIVVLLLAHGANLHARHQPRNWTPYQIALDNGQIRACEVLLAAGAQHEAAGSDLWEGGGFYPDTTRAITKQGAWGPSAYHPPDVEAARFLKLASRGETAQCAAMLKQEPALAGSTSLVESWGAIHVAAQNGHIEVVRLLLDGGVDVNSETHQDETALSFARWGGYRELSKLIEERGGKLGPL